MEILRHRTVFEAQTFRSCVRCCIGWLYYGIVATAVEVAEPLSLAGMTTSRVAVSQSLGPPVGGWAQY